METICKHKRIKRTCCTCRYGNILQEERVRSYEDIDIVSEICKTSDGKKLVTAMKMAGGLGDFNFERGITG